MEDSAFEIPWLIVGDFYVSYDVVDEETLGVKVTKGTVEDAIYFVRFESVLLAAMSKHVRNLKRKDPSASTIIDC